MSLASILAGVREKLTARTVTAETTYRELVRKLADGSLVKPDQVLQVLEGAGKSPEDLEQGVVALSLRREQQARVKELPGLTREREATEGLVKKEEAAIAAAHQRYDSATPPLLLKVRELEGREREAINLRGALITGCDDPQLLARRSAAEAKLRELRTKYNKLVNGLTLLKDHPPRAPKARRLWAQEDCHAIPITPSEHADFERRALAGRVTVAAPPEFNLEAALKAHAGEVARVSAEIDQVGAEIRSTEQDIVSIEAEMATA